MTINPMLIGAFLAGALVAGMAQEWRWDAAFSKQKSEHDTAYAQQVARAATAAQQKLMLQQEYMKQAGETDTRHTKELTDAKDENDRLRRLYTGADGRAAAAERRLRIQGHCAASGPGNDVPDTASAGSVGDATAVELSREAGSAVWDIREGVIEDRAKIAYLQDYALKHCPAPQ